MPRLQYGLSSYERADGGLPELPVVNMYAEEAPTEEMGVILQSRPGTDYRDTVMGSGPVEALFKRDLVEGSTLYGVSGGYFHDGATQVGAIDGDGPVSMAGNEVGIMTTAGSTLYFFTSDTLNPVAFPDGAGVAHVSVGGARYWMVRKDTGKLYFTDALESDVEALDFLTAESLPDRLLQTLWIDGALIGFGAESIEFFQQTGNADLPLVPLTNMVIEKGIRATNCAVNLGSTFACVTNENNVIIQNENNIVSNTGLQERIEVSSTVRLFTPLLDGVELLALRLDNETHIYNPRTRLWNEFETYGLANWGVQCFAGGVFGSAVDGRTLAWGTGYTDAQSASGVLERRFRAGGWLPIGTVISNLSLQCQVGSTVFLEGDNSAPIVEMRQSLDNGRTWGAYRQVGLGRQGEYDKTPLWRALGMSRRHKGRLFEFRLTHPVSWRVSDVRFNEAWGGR